MSGWLHRDEEHTFCMSKDVTAFTSFLAYARSNRQIRCMATTELAVTLFSLQRMYDKFFVFQKSEIQFFFFFFFLAIATFLEYSLVSIS